MDSKQTLPKRKELRIKQHDYSSTDAYFVTICVKDKKPILSTLTQPVGVGAHDDPQSAAAAPGEPVGVGAHDDPQSAAVPSGEPVGVGAHDDPRNAASPGEPQIRLTAIGRIAEKNLLSSENIPGVKIDRYVIMPDHIHAIIFLDSEQYIKRMDGSSRAPTPTNEMLPHVVSTFKRFCNKEIGSNLFQRGYMEHIVRDKEDYETRASYISANPARRYYREHHTEC